jgi:hypothetical protein
MKCLLKNSAFLKEGIFNERVSEAYRQNGEGRGGSGRV